MSTRSLIGKLEKDGTIKAVYCHYDGYISYNGRIIYENYKRRDVNKLLKNGNMSSLSESPNDCDFYKDNHSAFSVYSNINNYAKVGSRDCDAEYIYYIDLRSKWHVCKSWLKTKNGRMFFVLLKDFAINNFESELPFYLALKEEEKND